VLGSVPAEGGAGALAEFFAVYRKKAFNRRVRKGFAKDAKKNTRSD
jgi:hypothetical protein